MSERITVTIKPIFKSKTFWVAVVQAFAGVLIAVFTELDLVGYVTITKSLVDIMLRVLTTEPIKLK